MIWDAFLFGGELDMLECRLTELDGMDCRFIIAESDVTFQGNPKPLGFLENRERFAPWKDRITYLAIHFKEDLPSPWFREYESRTRLLEVALMQAGPEDLLIFGDVDEIPRSGVSLEPKTVLEMQHHLFAVDWLYPGPWRGGVVTTTAGLKPGNAKWLRDRRSTWKLVPNAGWHLSWLGGAEAAKEKARSFSHTEFTEKVCKWLDEGHCLDDGLVWDDSQNLTVQQMRVNSGFPRWVREGDCPGSWFRWK